MRPDGRKHVVTRLTDRIYDLDMGLAMALDREHNKTIRSVETHLWLAEEGWAEGIILSSGERATPKSFLRTAVPALIGKIRVLFRTEPGWFARAANVLKCL